MTGLTRNPLIKSLLGFRGNRAAIVFTEPLWGIPYNLYAPFMGIYMYALGVSYKQIGLIASVVMFLQVFSSFIGGVITDKLGRRVTLALLDLISWTIPLIIWLTARNFYFFLIAASINSLWQISANAWSCMIAEDAEKNAIVDIYNWIYISGQLVVFFAPFSAMLVKNLSVVPAMRILLGIAFFLMTFKFILMFVVCRETELGKRRIAETKGVKIKKMLAGYAKKLPDVFNLKSPEIFLTLMIMIIMNVVSSITGSFFGLLAVNKYHAPEENLAYYPIIRAVIFLFFMFIIQRRLNRCPIKILMVTGVAVYILSHLFLVFLPFGRDLSVIAYIFAEACAVVIFMPRRDLLLVSVLEPESRPVTLSIVNCAMLAVSTPFGYIGGALSNVDERLPFIMNIVLLGLAVLILVRFKNLSKLMDNDE